VDASLIAVDQQSAARYTLLDTVRAFLLDELDVGGGRTAAEDCFLRWAERTAVEIGRDLHSEDDAAADRRLRAELANLRAARDLSRRRGDLERRISITLALDRAGLYRGMSELWSWSRELAADPALSGHPLEVAVLGAGAEASWLSGDLHAAETLAQKGLAVARERAVDERLTRRCWSALATVALFQADFDTSLSRRLRAAELSDRPSTQLATAAMAAGYAGDHETAVALLARARLAVEGQPSDSDRAYYHYAAGEVAEDPSLAVRDYTLARELASSCGAGFVDGVAAVGLATAWSSMGDVPQAAEGFSMLLDYWPSTGNQTQLWTTVRNAALLLMGNGRPAVAALLLAAADASDSASAIGGHSGDPLTRAVDRLENLLDQAELTGIRATAATMGIAEVLRTAREELDRLRVRPHAVVPTGI
jgi:tetratricopeptide (TPR) repeat protein